MKLTEIPYIKLTGVQEESKNLTLTPSEDICNHVGTIHAGAIFTLAETQSGLSLQHSFPELKNQVVAIVRDASIRYKHPRFT